MNYFISPLKNTILRTYSISRFTLIKYRTLLKKNYKNFILNKVKMTYKNEIHFI